MGGVASALAAEVGVETLFVRMAFVVLTFASGIGVLLYALGWFLVPTGRPRSPLVANPQPPAPRTSDPIQAAALGAVVLGSILLLRNFGLWFPGRFVWPVVICAVGLSMVWARAGHVGRSRLTATLSQKVRAHKETGPASTPTNGLGRAIELARSAWQTDLRQDLPRIAFGVLFVLAGAGAFLASNGSIRLLRQSILAVVIVVVGLVLILGPWVMRLFTDLTEERSARIRSDERAELAAHLHDSVLQTLAIIQRQATDPKKVVALARRQERELRGWLYGDRSAKEGTPIAFGEALQSIADEVEGDHGIQVEVVRVGDVAMDDRVLSLVHAVREALVNAAKHARVERVDVYAEICDNVGPDDLIEVFVRDRGVGLSNLSMLPNSN